MENHILEGTYPNTIPKFTPRDANPKYKDESLKVASVGMVQAWVGQITCKRKILQDFLMPDLLNI